ncbi:hypothetical protein MNBD_GAMMA24-1047 [hydrothermal vent metagenome]|uniref:Uncharacterized protein n=1 Tax=hydrothermal vent metagenome TaxID=652676 RepID=A0A3B1BF59_9ZZZZ
MDEYSTDSLFPNHLSDEAAFELSESLNMPALLCDGKYFAQIRRHLNTRPEQQCSIGFATQKNIEEEDDGKPLF